MLTNFIKNIYEKIIFVLIENFYSCLLMSFLKKKKVPSSNFTLLLKRNNLKKIQNPLKNKLVIRKKKGGRNNQGRITIFTKGGGHKRYIRIITSSRENLSGIVESIEYDPNRTGDLARVYNFKTKSHSYVIAPKGLRRGHRIDSTKTDKNLPLRVGSFYQLKDLPLGSFIYDISFPHSKNHAIRAAGCTGVLVSKGFFCLIKLPSGEIRRYLSTTYCGLGNVSNDLNKLTNLGKAGRSRWLGRRPSVRGVAMNPIDHPHGGGEGKTSGGRPSVTPWGKVARGQKTRKKKINKYRVYIS